MSIQVGDKVPSVKLKMLGAEGMTEVDTAELCRGRKVIFFFAVGAFTPTCSNTHLVDFIQNADALKAKGVDEVFGVAVNDRFVMKAWGDQLGAAGKVTLLPDGNGELTRELGLEMDASVAGLGIRSKRFSMIVEDEVVRALNVEENPGAVVVSGAETCLAGL